MTTYTPKEYAEHLAKAGKALSPEVSKIVNRAAKQIRDDWKQMAAAKNPRHAPGYASTISVHWAKVTDGEIVATVEPVARSKKSPAKLGTILEYGGPRNAPQLSHVAALGNEAPKMAKYLAIEAAKVLQ